VGWHGRLWKNLMMSSSLVLVCWWS